MNEVDRIINFITGVLHPRSALLLNGKWGSGKTWILKEVIKVYQEDRDHNIIYISLNGVTNVTQIASLVIGELHPILGGKIPKIGKPILYTILKSSLSGDIADITKLCIDEALKKLMDEKPDDKSTFVIIFDDFERCSLRCKEIFGYLSRLIDNQNFRVIIGCNEDQIHSDDTTTYRAEKEKNIGYTLHAKPNVESAFAAFCGEIKQEKISESLSQIRFDIIKAFEESSCNNLRILRHAIHEWYRFISEGELHFYVSKLPPIARVFFPICIEAKLGNLQFGELHSLQMTHAPSASEGHVFTKYSDFTIWNTLISTQLLDSMLFNGEYNRNAIHSALGETGILSDQDSPAWIDSWGFRYLDLKEARLLQVVEELFANISPGSTASIGIVLHSVGNLIRISKDEVIDRTPEDIAEMCITFLDQHRNSIDWHISDRTREIFHDYSGMVYSEIKDPSFIKIVEAATKFRSEAIDSHIESCLASIIGGSIIDINPLLLVIRNENSMFYDKRIPAIISPQTSFDRLKVWDIDACSLFVRAIQYRLTAYDVSDEDKKWLESLLANLIIDDAQHSRQMRAKLKFYCARWIQNLIANRFEGGS